MGENKTKTKAAMLNELESIKGLLLEEDDIPILQEVIEQKITLSLDIPTLQPATAVNISKPETTETQISEKHIPKKEILTAETFEKNIPAKPTVETRIIFEEQQDFFSSMITGDTHENHHEESGKELLDTIGELEKHTAEVTANKFSNEPNKNAARPSLAKATGENPFLPEHIRSRLHGNNPPPLFANETARKISTSSIPSRQLGNTFSTMNTNSQKPASHQQDIIDSIIEKMMPEIEKELRNRLEIMSRDLLNEFNK